MAVRDIIQAAGGSAATSAAVYVEDVFSTYLYTGTGAETQKITNDINFSDKGGMVWFKKRDGVGSNLIADTLRANNTLVTNNNAGQSVSGTFDSFSTDGFTVRYPSGNFASWTFRKQAKFFDVVTWTGDGTAGRTISHSLGCVPGMIIVKNTSGTNYWTVYHKSLGATQCNFLNATDAQVTVTEIWNDTAPTSSSFTLGTSNNTNGTGNNYVAYLFADSNSGGFGAAGTDSIVACGSFTTDASGNLTSGDPVNLGWEPQYVLLKKASGVGDWFCADVMRGMSQTGFNVLYPNYSLAEGSNSGHYLWPTANGFSTSGQFGAGTYIYLAIRRGPMKTPTDATKVFKPVAYSGNGTNNRVLDSVGFPPDFSLLNARTFSEGFWAQDRLRGGGIRNYTNDTGAEYSTTSYAVQKFGQNDVTLGSGDSGYFNANSNTYIDLLFRRAPGFFDVVCYTGTGSAQDVSHNLGVAPELIITKRRDSTGYWFVYRKYDASSSLYSSINFTDGETVGGFGVKTYSTSTFGLGTSADVNTSAAKYVAYLFATCPGVSKVGSYTGSGTTKQIDCGFASGARFVLIKRTDSTGDWYVWDTARGIISANDPYLLLNSAAAEVTSTDYIDPYSAGFEISSSAPAAINASGGTFIYLAIA